jgi:hypothetical protein
MKRSMIVSSFFVVIFSLAFSTYPGMVWSNTTDKNLTTSTKIHKKSKKKTKKAKAQKFKVAKNDAGPMNDISDQTEVSQQADQSGAKKKK